MESMSHSKTTTGLLSHHQAPFTTVETCPDSFPDHIYAISKNSDTALIILEAESNTLFRPSTLLSAKTLHTCSFSSTLSPGHVDPPPS
ncbi:uncharacterized protein YALI1_D22476g [Yarrowia lipolytica]|uniref:Uncharacterized protein n=1 Tax=Yarrowia lipolytica TaxID=4952 RepID=A0A1D8NF24_YARLL|nr:hypothetical protein YALI1_D22476g [Yarrowia lipolytica]